MLCSNFKSGSKNSKFSPVLQGYLPWIYSFKVRVAVFREQIDREKRHYQQNMHQVQIRRDNIVEDAFDQFKGISGNILKGTIRIKFFNELGLSEAGIDQMGVFKEFIEILESLENDHLYVEFFVFFYLFFIGVLAEKLFSADFGLFRWSTGDEEISQNSDELPILSKILER